MKRDIPVYVTEFTVLDVLLAKWVDAVSRGKVGSGFPVHSPGFICNTPNDFEENLEDMDCDDARAMDMMIYEELAKHHRWAIIKSCGVGVAVWNYPNLDFAQTLLDARSDLERRAKRNIQTKCRF